MRKTLFPLLAFMLFLLGGAPEVSFAVEPNRFACQEFQSAANRICKKATRLTRVKLHGASKIQLLKKRRALRKQAVWCADAKEELRQCQEKQAFLPTGSHLSEQELQEILDTCEVPSFAPTCVVFPEREELTCWQFQQLLRTSKEEILGWGKPQITGCQFTTDSPSIEVVDISTR